MRRWDGPEHLLSPIPNTQTLPLLISDSAQSLAVKARAAMANGLRGALRILLDAGALLLVATFTAAILILPRPKTTVPVTGR